MVNFMDLGTLNATMGATVVAMVISFALTIYTVYLNWKQAKVNNQMRDLLEVNKNQLKQLETISLKLSELIK